MEHNGDSLSHAIEMMHMHIGNVSHHLNIAGGCINQLADAVDDKCFIDPESREAINLQNDAAELHRLGKALTLARLALIGNAPAKPKFLTAAE